MNKLLTTCFFKVNNPNFKTSQCIGNCIYIMIKNTTKIIGIIFITLMTINSCEKETPLSENNLIQGSNIEHKSNPEIPFDIINLCSFDFDAFIEGEYVDFEEVVTDDDGICYGIKITSSRAVLDDWIAREEAKGKITEVYEYARYYYNPNTKEMVRVVVLYIGISRNP